LRDSDKEALTRQFLEAYEAKDLPAISNLLATEVLVRDWNLEVIGKEAALLEFAKNFEQARSLRIRIDHLYSSKTAVAAEIEIVVNGNQSLRVIDVLTFNEAMEIASIVSYKGL
jgi:ketosteroid isomerase-like protein